MNKEKQKNKMKIKQNKYPLPKIKTNNNNINLKVKNLNNKIIQDSKNNSNLEQLKINYPKDQKLILLKSNNKVNDIGSIKNTNTNAKINNKDNIKPTLRYLLREYGLLEYYKKMNDIGYNNDNYTDIGIMTKKNFNTLINHINVLPFHYEKFEKFYEYVKKLNHNIFANRKNQSHLQEPFQKNTPQNPKRRFNFNFNSINYNLNKYGLNSKENSKVNNLYNQYQNYYNNYIAHINDNINSNNYHSNYNYNKNVEFDLYNTNRIQQRYSRKTLNINRRRKKKSYIKAKSRPRPHTSNPKLYMSKNGLNKNQLFKIRIRNNYSGKKIMKKKLQHFSFINSPYLNNISIDDNSTLIKSYFNDYQNMAENHKINLYNKNRKTINQNFYQNKPRNINNINDMNILYKIDNNDFSLNNEQDDSDIGISDNIERMLNHYMFHLNEKLDKSYESFEDSSLSHIITSQMNENQNQIQQQKEIVQPKENISPLKIEKIQPKKIEQNIENEPKNEIIINNINNNNEKKVEEIKKNEVEISQEIKKISEQNSSTKSKESKEQQIEDFEEKKYLTKEEAEKLLSNENESSDKKYNLEQNIYESIRLNKSFDKDNTDKETIKFDIEFICRCLGLALMKIIEQGQDKEHITDIYNSNITNTNKYNFTFLNEDFNNNISLIEEFFNSNSKNNELNGEENNKKILGDMNLISILEQLSMKKNEMDNKEINIIKHIKKTSDEKLIITEDNTEKRSNDFTDMDKELKFLGHFFSYKRAKIKDYQGLTENTKKILGKDLSYIKEIDSEINGTGSKMMNNSESNISRSNKTNNNIDNNGILNDSKNNQANMNKILDDSDENEDELLKGKCFDDLKYEEDKNMNSNNNNEIKSSELINTNSDNNQKDNKEQNPINSKYNNQKPIDNVMKISLKKEPEKEPISNPQDIEDSYFIDVENIQEFKLFLLSKFDVFDEDYIYITNSIPAKRLMQSPDPQTIFEFCANIMLLTKMEKETIIVALIYIERLIFNTGLLITSRNWRKIIFTSLIIASKIWDDDSLENLHFSQIFTHLKIGEINLLERNFMELINYKIYVKFSEYIKYYLAVKDMCLNYNFDGEKIVKIDPHKIIKIQEYKYQLQKRMNKTLCLNNSASF